MNQILIQLSKVYCGLQYRADISCIIPLVMIGCYTCGEYGCKNIRSHEVENLNITNNYKKIKRNKWCTEYATSMVISKAWFHIPLDTM